MNFINVNYANNCIKTVATFCFVALWKSLNYFTLYIFIELLQMNNKVAKFDKFIKDNDAKRRRAIQKYQIEVLLKEQKQTEYEQLCEQLAALKKRSTSQIRVELNVWNVSETVFMTRGERERSEREKEREQLPWECFTLSLQIIYLPVITDHEWCKLGHHIMMKYFVIVNKALMFVVCFKEKLFGEESKPVQKVWRVSPESHRHNAWR